MKVLTVLSAFALAVLVGLLVVRQTRSPPPVEAPPPSDERSSASTRRGADSSLDSLAAAGEALYWDGHFAEAREVWAEALDRSRRLGNRRAEALALTWLGLAAFRSGEYPQARALGEEALALKVELGVGSQLAMSYNALGLLAWTEGRLAEAAGLFDKATSAAAAENDEEYTAKAANNLGLVYTDLGEFARARTGFEAGLSAARRLGDRLIEGRTLSNLGMLEIQTGDPSTGIVQLEQARLLYRSSADVTGELNTLGQVAIAYSALGEPRRAFTALDTALALSRQHGHRSEEASALELLGDMYLEAGDPRRALDLYGQARELNRRLGLRIEEGMVIAREARAYAELGDVERARVLAGEAAELHQTAGAAVEMLGDLLLLVQLAGRAGEEAAAARHLGEARLLAGRLDSRAARVSLALAEAGLADRAANASRVLDALENAGADLEHGGYRDLSDAEVFRARAHARLGDLERAAEAGHRAVAALERVRDRFGSGILRTTFLANRLVAYTDLIDVLLRQGRVEGAFEVADAARGRAFVEHLTTVPGLATSSDATARQLAEGERLLGEIGELVTRRDELEGVPPEERDPAADRRANELAAKLEEARGRYEDLLVRIAERDGPAATMLGGRRVRSVEVRRSLRPGEVLLEYVVTPQWAIVLAATRDRVESFAVPTPASDVSLQARVARELAGRPPPAPSASAVLERLYATLIGPLEGSGALTGARRLFIVPDAALGHVPFSALRDADGVFLAERFVITHLPAAGALPVLRRRRDALDSGGSSRAASLTVFAPMPESLPASGREAEAIRRTRQGTRLVLGERATEERVRRELASVRTVHVASHGVLDGANPLFSRIELARGGSDAANDGRLEVHEILGLSIASPLVFLSGCETESGTARSSSFAGGDDYATLSRAFLYAGARSVIATLWRINDEGAAAFATRFYEHLRSRSEAEALAQAQRDLIRSKRYSSPYYWASYRLTGETRSISDPGESDAD